MVEIVKLRVILDVEEDVFRDLEIEMDAPLMHLHLATLDAFNWNDAHEMASFYKSNDAWDKGDEFPLMAMSPDLPSMESAKSSRRSSHSTITRSLRVRLPAHVVFLS